MPSKSKSKLFFALDWYEKDWVERDKAVDSEAVLRAAGHGGWCRHGVRLQSAGGIGELK